LLDCLISSPALSREEFQLTLFFSVVPAKAATHLDAAHSWVGKVAYGWEFDGPVSDGTDKEWTPAKCFGYRRENDHDTLRGIVVSD
jgi:hypothetical protein